MTTFKELGLSSEVLKVLQEMGFEKPSKIQAQAIPHLLTEDVDFIGLAQTGTGKTAAFGLPLLERVDPSIKATQGIVLAPTRELGQQIARELEKFGKYLDKVNTLAVYGGTSIVNQIRDLKRTQHVIIATPGRLIDLIKRRAVKLDQLRFVVLDEADEMLNMGFKDELDEILSYTPEEKTTWLFSATMPDQIKRIVKKYMSDPIEVRINSKDKVNTNIEHQFAVVRQSDKTEAMMRFLDINPAMRGLVFCRTKRGTQELAEWLLSKNYKADALHGDLSQAQRDRVMTRFREKDLQVLIATDVAARGIDVDDLTHVFHYSLPDDAAYYTHRSGRTARAGKKGISLAFVDPRDSYKLNRIEKQLGISCERVLIPKIDAIADIRIENWCLELLEKKSKTKIPEELLGKVKMLLGTLSKQELVEKILADELEKLNLGSGRDLNDIKKRTKSSSDRRGDRRGGRDRKKRDDDRGGNRKRKYKGGGSSKFGGAKKKKSSDGKKKRY